MADVTIEYKGTNIATMDASGTKTLETSGKYCEGDVQVVYADPEKPMQSKSATPSLSAQTIFPDSGKVLSSVSVAAITKELLATLDSDFAAENIKKDVNLFGLLGTLEGGGNNIATGTITYAVDTNISATPNNAIYHNLGRRAVGLLWMEISMSGWSRGNYNSPKNNCIAHYADANCEIRISNYSYSSATDLLYATKLNGKTISNLQFLDAFNEAIQFTSDSSNYATIPAGTTIIWFVW